MNTILVSNAEQLRYDRYRTVTKIKEQWDTAQETKYLAEFETIFVRRLDDVRNLLAFYTEEELKPSKIRRVNDDQYYEFKILRNLNKWHVV